MQPALSREAAAEFVPLLSETLNVSVGLLPRCV